MNVGNYKIRHRVTRARLFLDWAPAILWAALLLSLGGNSLSGRATGGFLVRFLTPIFGPLSFDQLIVINWTIRKCAHICSYAILGLLNYRAIRGGRPGWSLRWSVMAVLMAFAVAVADELHQTLSPQRTAAIVDVGFDLWGAVVSQFLVRGRRR